VRNVHGPAVYNPNARLQQQYNTPPAYGQGGYYGENQGYFGGQQTGIEMQPPQNVYGGGGAYQPPRGPPPAKGDGIIR
jgi:hypothetical protein